MHRMIPFNDLVTRCRNEGLHAIACIDPPERLDPAGIDQATADGLGDLGWLAEQRDKRLDPRSLQPSARSLIVVAWHHQPDDGCGTLRRARYAAGKDYHLLLRQKLARVGRGLGGRQRACVDSAPINERTLAQLAGLGWIGKNALVIDPERGSYRFLGVLLTDVLVERHRGPHGEDRCGTCTRCHVACPTQALVGRRVLTTRCISYLTIEHQGVIPRDLAERFNGWWFGCDLCQVVCPWNRFAPPADDPRLTGSESDERLLAVTAETFDVVFAGRAVRRLRYDRFRRNLLVALWSLGRREELAPIIAEGLPLVLEQAAELGLC